MKLRVRNIPNLIWVTTTVFSMVLIAMGMAWGQNLPQEAIAGEIPSVVKEALPQVEIQRVEHQEFISPLYTVFTPQGILYLDGSGRFLFSGDLYDLQSGENLTQVRLSNIQRVVFKDLPLADAILYKKGAHRIAVFDDPDCPYCQKLHKELGKLDTEIYIFLFPLTNLHPLAYRKSVSVWCSPDRIAALERRVAHMLERL